MARMIPPVLDEQNTPSPGERSVFRLLESAPGTEDWTVLHSQRLARVKRKAQGEADFVVLVPNKGLLVLEVKAHRVISREDGVWLFGSNRERGEDPLEQASKAMHSIRTELRQALPASANAVLVANAVVFTHVVGSRRSPEWRPSQLIEADEVTSELLPKAILRALDDEADHLGRQGIAVPGDTEGSHLPSGLIEAIVDTLRPKLDLVISWSAWRAQHTDRLLSLTRQQYSALDLLSRNSRVLFEGPAGTGKTVLAIEAARRALDRGDRVLVVCHNRPLAQNLAAAFKDHPREEDLEVGTLHSFLLQLTGVKRPPDDNAAHSFFTHDLPELALEFVMSSGRFDRQGRGFDTIVIDELQDLANDAHLQLLPELLRTPAGTGRILAFGDLENQAFFESRNVEEIRLSVSSALGPGLVTGTLTANCRNTKRTVELVESIVDVSPPYTDQLGEESPEPVFKPVSEYPAQELVVLLDQLEAKGVSPSDIAVLTLAGSRVALASRVTEPRWRDRLKDGSAGLNKRDVLATSVFRFKGLERPVVILTDGDAADPVTNQEAWYVGLTRSTAETIVLIDAKTRDTLLRLQFDRTAATQ